MSFLDGEKQPRYEEEEDSPQHEYNALVDYIHNVELRKTEDAHEEEEEVAYRRVSGFASVLDTNLPSKAMVRSLEKNRNQTARQISPR